VVVLAAAVYSPAMPETTKGQVYCVDPACGPAGRLVLRAEAGHRTQYLVIAQYQGPKLPTALTDPVVESYGAANQLPGSWCLSCAEGRFDFQALAVDQLEECPALYEPLHRPYRLSTSDRLAVRVLLWLLRLPGGAAWLRRWHAHRH